MKFLKYTAIFLLLLLIVYFLGPHPSAPAFSAALPAVPADLSLLEKYIAAGEAAHKVKPDNEARIIWNNDSIRQKTEYAIVYLHGFTASHEEGDPIHTALAKKFGCNLFLARLADHGLDTADALLNCTAERLWTSAKEAYAVGKQIGKKVVLVSTSTGGTLSLMLAAQYRDIAGIILLSPNIEINDPNAWLANNPWGLQMARLIKKSDYIFSADSTAIEKKYWYTQYRLEAVAQLEELLESSMTEKTFKKVTQPVLMLYYYKDEAQQDKVVKVSAMKRMFEQLSTPQNKKSAIAVPQAGNHVIGSYIKSGDTKTVQAACENFFAEILQVKAAL